jgi:N-formylglutamate deformylase
VILAEGTVWPYRYRRGTSALIVSMPHVGTFVPHSVGHALTDCAARRPDTDWHLPRLYDFVDELGATVIEATHSRYVVDVNRPPDGSNLYPGWDTPRLCPIDTFHSEPLYRARDGSPGEPGEAEIRRRVDAIWGPYHRRLAAEIARVQAEHGIAMLWDAHSIVSEVPRLFEGRLADFNLGTADGASCDPGLADALAVAFSRHAGYTTVLNGRFKGGYITRRYGAPAQGVHAVQLEMAEATYMDETSPYSFRPERAGRVREILREQLDIVLDWARREAPAVNGKHGASV